MQVLSACRVVSQRASSLICSASGNRKLYTAAVRISSSQTSANAPYARPFGAAPQLHSSRTFRSSLIANAGSCSCAEANQLVAGDSHAYLDVRTAEEFNAGHPTTAVNIPVYFMGPGGMTPNPDFVKQVEAKFDKDAAICVGCKSGKRSLDAIQILSAEGYTNLSNVEGGFMAWEAAGLPISK